MAHGSVFDILQDFLAKHPGLSPSDLAEKLVQGVFDPRKPLTELTRLVVECESILDSDCDDADCNARILEAWKSATSPAVIAVVSEWAGRVPDEGVP